MTRVQTRRPSAPHQAGLLPAATDLLRRSCGNIEHGLEKGIDLPPHSGGMCIGGWGLPDDVAPPDMPPTGYEGRGASDQYGRSLRGIASRRAGEVQHGQVVADGLGGGESGVVADRVVELELEAHEVAVGLFVVVEVRARAGAVADVVVEQVGVVEEGVGAEPPARHAGPVVVRRGGPPPPPPPGGGGGGGAGRGGPPPRRRRRVVGHDEAAALRDRVAEPLRDHQVAVGQVLEVAPDHAAHRFQQVPVHPPALVLLEGPVVRLRPRQVPVVCDATRGSAGFFGRPLARGQAVVDVQPTRCLGGGLAFDHGASERSCWRGRSHHGWESQSGDVGTEVMDELLRQKSCGEGGFEEFDVE